MNDENQQHGSELTEDERAEYERLEAEEAAAAELAQGDAGAEQAYPVENGAMRWDDAANGGDTSREKQAVYDTPWGRRALSAIEVQDFSAQGVTVTRVDDEPQTSLEQEREELRKIELRNVENKQPAPGHNPFA